VSDDTKLGYLTEKLHRQILDTTEPLDLGDDMIAGF
jgi:hypothetical protein